MRRTRESCDDSVDGESQAVVRRLETSSNGGCRVAQSDAASPFTKRLVSSQRNELLAQRATLPVYEKADKLKNLVQCHQVVLLIGETGSGKTTQVPQFVAEMGFPGIIACTQPRRIAAMSVAARVAEEVGVQLGAEVGYQVRFQSMMSEKTKVLYMTDGMLLRGAFSDHNLSGFSVVIVDEAHERTVDTDVLLGVVRLILERRPEFRLIVMSATLDIQKFKAYFPSAPELRVTGRMYDVQVKYAQEPVKDYIESCVECVCSIHLNEPPGDVLCFLTGEAEIEKAVTRTKVRLDNFLVQNNNATRKGEGLMLVEVLPLYGSLSLEDQKRVFASCGPHTRKVIFATNIAETSLTINGIVYVVDSGYHKQSLYNSEVRVDYLLPALISKASAEQRKGRAGRTRPGKCFRLFRQQDFAMFPDQTYPEVLRSSLVNTVLLLLKLEVKNPYQFAFIDPPSQQSIMDAYYQLSYFGAVDDDLQLTSFGKLMAELPVDASLARMILLSEKHGCGADAAVIAAMLEVGNVFLRPAARGNEADQQHAIFEHPDGDHLALFNVFHAFWRSNKSASYCFDYFLRYQALLQAVSVHTQLIKLMRKKNIPLVSTYNDETKFVDSVALRKTVLEGFFMQVAYKAPNAERYMTIKDSQLAVLHRQSVLSRKKRPAWIVYDRLEVHGKEETFIRISSAIEPKWLLSVSELFTEVGEFADGEICHILQGLLEENNV